MKSNVALIGFMGAGKTTTGRALAAKLQREFIDMDVLIAAKAGKTITQIFEQDGENAFRKLEKEIAWQVSLESHKVIACGGGITLNQINIDRLKQSSIIVYLTATLDVLMNRALNGGDERPLLKAPHKIQEMQRLLEARLPLYQGAADITIDASTSSETIIEQITWQIKNYACFIS